MPWNETAIGVVYRLGERVPQSRLSAKVHIPKQELPQQIRRNSRRLGFLVPINDGSSTVVEQTTGERAKVKVRGEKRRGLRGEGCRGRVRFGEGSGVCFIGDDFVKLGESNGLSATVSSCRRLETQLGKCWDREISIRTGKIGIRRFLTRAENAIDVRLLGRYGWVKIERGVPRIREILRRRNRSWNVREFFAGLARFNTSVMDFLSRNISHILNLGDAHRWLAVIHPHQFIRIIQSPPHLRDHLHPGLFGHIDDLIVSLLRICIRILFEHQMRDTPCFEQLDEHRLRSFSNDKEFGFGIQLGNRGGEI